MSQPKMNSAPTRESQHRQAFSSIYEFVTQLNTAFVSPKASKAQPITLYKRLMDVVKINDYPAMERFVHGFSIFYDLYSDLVVQDQLDQLPSGTTIRYQSNQPGGNDRVYIPIELFYRKTDPETKAIIRQHLLSIGTQLGNTHKNGMAEALKMAMASGGSDVGHINPNELNEKEKEFIKIFSQRLKEVMGHVDEHSSYEDMFRRALDMGVLTEMTTWITTNGSAIDPSRLIGLLQRQMMDGFLKF